MQKISQPRSSTFLPSEHCRQQISLAGRYLPTANGYMITAKEGRIMMQASLFENGEMKATEKGGAFTKWVVKDRRPFITVPQLNTMNGRAGLCRQDTAALHAQCRISGTP